MSKEVFIEYVFDHTKESEGVFGEPEVPSKDKDLLASLLKKLPSLSEEEFVTMCIESIKESESFFSLLIRIRGLTLNKFLVDSSFKSKNSRVNVKKIIQQLIELEKIGFGTAHSLPLGEYFLEIVVRPLYWIMKGLVDGDPKGITNAILEITRYG
ncbi:hypothetical protein, partial [Thermus sp.]|uniref:hypothetical protein n=1 Tax=Thermus sp. TaxID=275 RepID=UPI0025E4FBDB